MVTEAQLMKDCSPLYPSIAIEALTGLVMGLLFLYLWIKISTRNDLKSPAGAVYRLASHTLFTSMRDLKKNMSRWTLMPKGTMGERFAFCRKANQAILLFQAFVAFISITRWLHINNINGFRYLGYAITCPFMQAQLILLIAPVVPCYRIAYTITLFVTFCQLIIGWIASSRPEPLLGCGWEGLIAWDPSCFDYTNKFWTIVPAVCNQIFLSFVQIPCLGMLYLANGGGRNPLLPPGYLKLLAIVAFTWLGFPAWWFISYEGMGILTDTKLNSIGFAVLNLVSKGALSFQVLKMTKQYRSRQVQRGEVGRERRGSTDSIDLSEQGKVKPRTPHGGTMAPNSVGAWCLRLLQNFDDGAPCVPPDVTSMYMSGVKSIEPISSKDQCFEAGEWSRQRSGDSLISTIDSKDNTSAWHVLDPMYKRFLKDCGVSQDEFLQISLAEKMELRSKFDQVASTVLVDKMGNKTPRGMDDVSLADATDEQVLKEMQRRLLGTSEKRHEERPQKAFSLLPAALEDDLDDDIYPECEVDTTVPGRRGYQV